MVRPAEKKKAPTLKKVPTLKALGIAKVRELILTNLRGTPARPIDEIIATLPLALAREVIFGEGNNLENVIELVTPQDFEVIAALAEEVEDKAILCDYNVRFDKWPRVKQVTDLAKEQGQLAQLFLNQNGVLLTGLIMAGEPDIVIGLMEQLAVEGRLREVCAIRQAGFEGPRSLVDVACAIHHMRMAQRIFDVAKANGMVGELVTPAYFVVECSRAGWPKKLLKLALTIDAASNDQELIAAMRVAAQAHFLPEQPFNVAMFRCNNVRGGIYTRLLLEQSDVVEFGQSPNVAAIRAMMSVCKACALEHIPVVADRLRSVDRTALTPGANDAIDHVVYLAKAVHRERNLPDASLERRANRLRCYVAFCSDEELQCFESVIRQVGSYVAQYADKIPALRETAIQLSMLSLSQASHLPKLPTETHLAVMERMVPKFILQKPEDLAVEDSKWQRLQLLAAKAVREAGLDAILVHKQALEVIAMKDRRRDAATSNAAAAAPETPSSAPEPDKAETVAYQDHEHSPA